MAHVAATIRNNGSVNPEAIYYGRGPYTPADIRSSRPVAEPFNLLDCATTSEGATALLVTTAERAAGLRCPRSTCSVEASITLAPPTSTRPAGT